jgi:hypothetical protein
MTFTAGIWSIQGDAAAVRRSSERSVIIDFLADNPKRSAIPNSSWSRCRQYYE